MLNTDLVNNKYNDRMLMLTTNNEHHSVQNDRQRQAKRQSYPLQGSDKLIWNLVGNSLVGGAALGEFAPIRRILCLTPIGNSIANHNCHSITTFVSISPHYLTHYKLPRATSITGIQHHLVCTHMTNILISTFCPIASQEQALVEIFITKNTSLWSGNKEGSIFNILGC